MSIISLSNSNINVVMVYATKISRNPTKPKSTELDSPQRIFDMNVSIQRYGAEVEYRCGGAHHIYSDPYVAELCAEHPVALQVVDQRKRHNQCTDKQVGDG